MYTVTAIGRRFASDPQFLKAFLDQRQQQRRSERRIEPREVGCVTVSGLSLRLEGYWHEKILV